MYNKIKIYWSGKEFQVCYSKVKVYGYGKTLEQALYDLTVECKKQYRLLKDCDYISLEDAKRLDFFESLLEK